MSVAAGIPKKVFDHEWINRVYWNVFLCELEAATRVQKAFYDDMSSVGSNETIQAEENPNECVLISPYTC